MRECACKRPRMGSTPSRCASCTRLLNPEWVASDETFARFFDHLASSIPGWPELPPSFVAFREQCEARELAGRATFGFAYLDRDNPVEATEEFADGAIYAFLDTLAAIRADDDEELVLALDAARKAWQAHEAISRLRSRRRSH